MFNKSELSKLERFFSFDSESANSVLKLSEELDIVNRLTNCLDYIYSKLEIQNITKRKQIRTLNLNKLHSCEWYAFRYQSIEFLVRRYSSNLTIFYRWNHTESLLIKLGAANDIRRGAFFLDKVGSISDALSDVLYDYPLFFLAVKLDKVVEGIKRNNLRWLSLASDKKVKLKPLFSLKPEGGALNSDFVSWDGTFFCLEELILYYRTLYCRNELQDILRSVEIGSLLPKTNPKYKLVRKLKSEEGEELLKNSGLISAIELKELSTGKISIKDVNTISLHYLHLFENTTDIEN